MLNRLKRFSTENVILKKKIYFASKTALIGFSRKTLSFYANKFGLQNILD